MRVVDLADQYHLTTAEAIDLCLAAGIPADSASTQLTDEQVAHWQGLAEQQRQWREAARAAVAAREAAASQGIDPDTGRPVTDFGPIPPAPWEVEGEGEGDGTGAAPRMRTPNEDIPAGWGVGRADAGKSVSPYAAAALALAVVSIILPFVTGFLALGLAWLAKSRIRRSNGTLTGEGIATVAQVVAGIGIAVWIGLLGYAIYTDYRTSQSQGRYADLQIDGDVVQYDQLAPKMCVRVPHADIAVKNWQTVSCDAPHEAEVIGVHTLGNPAGYPYPGKEALTPSATEMCSQDFSDYVGIPYARSEMNLAIVFPTAGNWVSQNDRHVVCVVYQPDWDYINGTAANARR